MERVAGAHPKLTAEQLVRANSLIKEFQNPIENLAEGKLYLIFVFRRKVAKALTHLERRKPMKRKRLKVRVWKAQHGLCAECGKGHEQKGSILDRRSAKLDYVDDNVQLIHRDCYERRQAAKKYA